MLVLEIMVWDVMVMIEIIIEGETSGLALSSDKVVSTEKKVSPPPPVLILNSVDFTAEIALSKPPYGDNAVAVFVNGLMQPPADYTLSDTKLTFKAPSHYAKGDTVNILYLTAA